MTTAALTGHRPQSLGLPYDARDPQWDDLAERLIRVYQSKDVTRVITGMALGWDQLGAYVAITEGIPFTAAIPFDGQENRWPEISRRRYHDLLNEADEIVYCSDPGYAAWKMHFRNKWIVDHSDLLIGCHDGRQSGGTWNCLQYAERVARDTHIIRPNVAIPA